MFKKFVIILSLTIFSSNILAQEILMKCKYNIYTYIADTKGEKIYSANIKSREKKKVREYCPSSVNETNYHQFLSLEGVEYSIDDYKGICKVSKVEYTNGNTASGVEFVDFKNETYGYEVILNGKPTSYKENCKIESRK